MDPGHQANFNGGSILFTLEKIPYTAFGSDVVHRPKMKPKLLSLFPLKPAFKPLGRKTSLRSFSGKATQQIPEQDSRAVVAIRDASEFESQDGSALSLSTLLPLQCVPEKTDVQNPFKQIRLIDWVCNQSSSTPSAAVNEKCLVGVGQFVYFKSRSSHQYPEASTTSVGKSNESELPSRASASVRKSKGSALLSRLSAINAPPLSLACPRPDHTTEGQPRAHAVRNIRPSARHGPRPRSSSYRGVTHYKRTGRWEAHIWNKGKQIYLGASSTAEKAARAYDRAAIHFRTLGAELNFCRKDYSGESLQLVELPESELVSMLRRQSAGEGTVLPEYPPIIEPRKSPRENRASKYSTVRNKKDQVEPITHTRKQLDSELVPNRVQADVRTTVQTDQPQGGTFHVPKAAHVSKRSGQYIQVIENITADRQNLQEWLN